MKNEIFLSEQDEDTVIKFLYEAGLYMTIGMDLNGLVELKQAMKKLEPTGADIILRKYLSKESDYTSHQAIYKELGLTYYTYKKHHQRALTKLATELEIYSLERGC